MDAMAQMDRHYRYQRYVYDLSRKYYLLGRDQLLDEIPLREDETLLEIGCGTARNLIGLARRHPGARLFGLDASGTMLATARKNIGGDSIPLRQGLADQVNYRDFGLDEPFDHILFSYVLSMIPGWRSALEQALRLLKPGGAIHIVDFADQQAMPRWFRGMLLTWLHWFQVHPDPELPGHLQQLAGQRGDELQMRFLPGRYALLGHYRKAS